MKKFFLILSVAALSFVAISSCTKEIQAPSEETAINFTVVGGDKALDQDAATTKTYVSEEDNTVHVFWQDTDKLRVYEIIDGGDQVFYATSSAASVSDGGKKATFETKISTSVVGDHDSYIYTAIYPSDCASKSGENYRVLIPETQNLSGTNLASDADVLIGAPIDKGSTRVSEGDVFEYQFKRLGTTVKMTLKGITANEKLQKVEIEAPEYISGYSNVDLTTGNITGRGTTKKTVSLILDNYVVNGDTPLWFRVLSGTWNVSSTSPLVIKAYTDKAMYSKTVSSTKVLEFAEGGLTTFGVSLGSRTENPVIADGDYVIAAMSGDNYYAMSCLPDAKGTRLAYTDITKDFSEEEYSGNNYDIVWHFATSSNGLAITTVNGEYLTSGASVASVATEASYFSIKEKLDDTKKYYNIYSGSNYLELNVNNWFAFYSSDPSASMIRNLFVIPANVDKTPSITLVNSEVSLPSSTTIYEISYSKRFLTGDVTAEEASDVSNIISNLSVVGNKVVVTLVPNTAAESKSATINICSTADKLSVPFTITLQQYRPTVVDILTADLFKATSSTYTAFNDVKKTEANTINSDAVYAGKTAKNSGNIQLNNNSGIGIWTTTSGGYVSTVSVTYGDDNGKVIKVYGSNTDYESDDTSNSTLIGTLDRNNLSIIAAEKFEYILFKSSGATYPASLSINWVQKPTVSSIAVKTAPTNTTYHVGDNFDPTGLVITATYDDNTTEDIAYAGNEGKFTFNPSLTSALQASNSSVGITYGGKSTSQSITVREWTCQSINITTNPSKMSYYVGESFDPTGMVISATYNDGVKDDVREGISSGYTIDPSNKVFTEAEIPTGSSVTVQYAGKSTTLSGITIKAAPSLKFNVTPNSPIEISSEEYDGTPIAIDASAEVEWTVTLSAGDSDAIAFDESGTGSVSGYEVLIDANDGAERSFTLHFATEAAVAQKTYDVTINQAAATSKYVKITSTSQLTNGQYLIVYENSDEEAYVFNGVDTSNDYVRATISNNEIASSADVDLLTVTINAGYTIKIDNGDNAGKFIYGKSGSNSIQFGEATNNTISFEDGKARIESDSTSLRFNSASNNYRFRYYKTTTTGASYTYVCLYKKVN